MENREPGSEADRLLPPARRAPSLVVMVGPPATGKSYLVRQVAERAPVEVVETDEIRHRINPQPTYSPAENRRVFYLAHHRIGRLLREGKDVVFDATNIYERGRRTLYRIAESNGARLLLVRTVASERVVEERLRRRRGRLDAMDRSDAGWEVYARMKAKFQEIRRPHLVVDTSQDLEPAVDRILGFLRGEG